MSNEAVEILLVEDSPDDVAFLVRTFNKANLTARLHVVADGKEALDYLFCTGEYATRNNGNQPKVIFLDMKMPKVGGLEVLRRLKADPTTQSIPIVALSSSNEERDLIESYRYGVNSYIVKPMDFDQFAKTIRLMGQYWLELNQTPKL